MGGYWICYNYESISFVNFYYKSGSLGNGSAYAKSWDNGEKPGRYYINNNHVYHDCVINCNGSSRYSSTFLTPLTTQTPILTAKFKNNGAYYKGTAYWSLV